MSMNIYVDFDDCLCETARYFSKLAAELFVVNVPYEKIKYFNLQKSFSLNDEQYEQLMIKGHKPEVLLSYDEALPWRHPSHRSGALSPHPKRHP